MTLKDTDKKYILNTYKRFDLLLKNGKGSLVYDENGKEYIDFTSGIGVNSFGLCDDVFNEAVKKQLDTLTHMSNLYYTEPCIKLAKLICDKTDMNKVFFCNSGAEANECAIKIARKYMAEKKGASCYRIITLENSFHGRTVTTLSATGQEKFHKDFQPLTDGFIYSKANDIDDLKNKITDDTAAIMIECIQGEGGVNVLDKKYVKEVAEIVKEKDILLIIDEVQTGNGRTGKLYSYMDYDIQPDIFTTAKGLGSGLPIGACVVNEKTENAMVYGDHGSTFGGNPVVCAGAVTVIERLTDDFLNDVIKKGQLIQDILEKDSDIQVTGKGLMIGVKTEKDISGIIQKCMNNGLLVLSAKDKIRLLPPLNTPDSLVIKGANILRDILLEN